MGVRGRIGGGRKSNKEHMGYSRRWVDKRKMARDKEKSSKKKRVEDG